MIAFPKILQPKYLVFAVLATYFFFGFQHLSQFVTADEHYWVYERIPQYWDAIAEGKWKKTFINDKPGVSLALVSGVGYLLHPDSPTLCAENNAKILVCRTDQIGATHRDFRLPILIVNGFILLLLFFLITRITNPWIALWTTLLTALSPILLGISQIVNPDSLLWSFGAAAIFSYFALLKSEEKKFLWLTILFTGLAILAKYVALILLPFYLTLAVFRFLTTEEPGPVALSRLLKRNILSWILIVIGSILLLCLFLPALLSDAKYLSEFLMAIPDQKWLIFFGGGLLALLYIDTFALKNRLLFAIRQTDVSFSALLRMVSFFFLILFIGLVIARNFFPDWSIFALIPFDIKDLSDARYYTAIPDFFEAFLLEWNPLVFSLTPVALIGFAAILLAPFGKTKNEHTFLICSLLFFFLAYSALLIFSNVLATPRYSILLYPLFALLAALGIWHITERISRPYAKLAATAIVFLGSLASLVAISPFSFNYTNVLLPKSALISDAWGYGGYEAAQYLNALPDAKNLTVWADYYGTCEFFVGKCLTAYTFDANVVKPDYYVLTRRGQIRYMSRYERWEVKSGLTAYKYYAIPDPAWQLMIDDRPGNFVKVVKVNK